MLRKLMKYDLRAIFKYWWIVALSSVGLSVIGGTCLSFLVEITSSDTIPENMTFPMILATLGFITSIIGISAFLIATELFIYIRFYQSFFSDEGYLTFTLPVKRSELLGSKLLSALITNATTIGVIVLDILIFVVICMRQELFKAESWQMISSLVGGTIDTLGIYIPIYIIEAIVILLCLSTASYLLIFACISFAAMIAKKHKVFAAIGIYYLVSTAISFVMQILMIFGSISLAGIFEALPTQAIPGVFVLLLLAVALFIAAVAAILYTVEHYLLDKKLNLS